MGRNTGAVDRILLPPDVAIGNTFMGSAKYPSFGDMGLELVVVVVGTLATSFMTAYGRL